MTVPISRTYSTKIADLAPLDYISQGSHCEILGAACCTAREQRAVRLTYSTLSKTLVQYTFSFSISGRQEPGNAGNLCHYSVIAQRLASAGTGEVETPGNEISL
eukprot:4712012-Pleurochrysis_carterae.AAC.1